VNDAGAYATTRLEAGDTRSGFRSGVHALDDYFARHAFANDAAGVGRAYVLRRSDADDGLLPKVLGFYTLSMAQIESKDAAAVLKKRVPRYPLPAALVGRLAVDERARGQRLGERLLVDALRRVVDTAAHIVALGSSWTQRKPEPAPFMRSTTSLQSKTRDGRGACLWHSKRLALCSRRRASRSRSIAGWRENVDRP
jgi:GNAT superfamily N-acetyltransferase